MISDFPCAVSKIFTLLRFYAVLIGVKSVMFWDNHSVHLQA